ncbi:Replicative DNA helicase [Candidatus Magnetomoraceae bacterium gMMP-15]
MDVLKPFRNIKKHRNESSPIYMDQRTDIPDPMLQKLPPQSIEAEQSILSAILIDSRDNSSGNALTEVMEILSPQHFYREAHRKIFAAILELFGKNEPTDIISLLNKLREKDSLESVGGASYLSRLMDSVPMAVNIVHYAKIIRKKAILRRLIENSSSIITKCYQDQGDLDEVMDFAENAIFEISQDKIKPSFYSLNQIMTDTFETLEERGNNQTLVTGVPSGFTELDKLTSGFQASDLIILAARPSCGKTSLALNFARNAAVKSNIPVAFFSLEMSKEQLAMRMLCTEARVDFSRIRRGIWSKAQYKELIAAANLLSDAPIFIDDSPSISAIELRAKARRLAMENDLGLIIVDYLQLMKTREGAERRDLAIGEISGSFKALAKELNIPVIALSQLNRKLEERGDKRPLLADLRESGCLAGDSIITNSDTGERYTIKELANHKDKLPIKTKALDKDLKLKDFKINNAFFSGIKKVYEVKTKSGRTIKATANHKFYRIDGWNRLDCLNIGDKIAIPEKIKLNIQNNPLTNNELILIAHLLGDGCILESQQYHYTNSDMENIKIVNKTVKELFNIDARIVKQKSWWHTYFPSPYHLTHGVRHPITNWFEQLKIERVHSYDKKIPERVFLCDNHGVKLFLKHLWATDGSISTKKIKGRKDSVSVYYCSTSIVLCKQVQSLLLRIGIISKLTKIKQVKNNKEYRPIYYVIIQSKHNLLNFLENINSYGKRGENTLKYIQNLHKIKENPNNGCIDKAAWKLFIEPAKNKAKISWRKFAQLLEMSYSGSSLFKNGISKARMKRISNFFNELKLNNIANSEIYWDEIVSIIQFDKEETYDITVENAHNFIANDIIVHNSLEQDADLVMFIYRDEIYNKDESNPNKGTAEILLRKQRNGPTGDIKLVFQAAYTRFENSISNEAVAAQNV